MSGDGREQRTSVEPSSTPGRFMVVYDGGVIGHVERIRRLPPHGGLGVIVAAPHARHGVRWRVSGQPGEHRTQGDAVAHLVRTHRGPR